VQHRIESSFHELSAAVPATVGIAIDSAWHGPALSVGTWSTGAAWSTIKVPLAIAAVRAGSGGPDLVAKTIADSDNAAAEELWSRLGNPADAAQHVQAVINDPTTVVESRRLRPEYTAFGQTQWSLVRQAHFAALLPQIPDASGIIDLMHNLCPDHCWGLATKGFAAKGGWGPGIAERYLVRQFGIVPVQGGHVGVALAADAHDGEFKTGVDVVNGLADWLVEHLAELTKD
jgi:hypothetical protein